MNMESPESPKRKKRRTAGNQVDDSSAELQRPSQSMLLSDADILMVASRMLPDDYYPLGTQLRLPYPVQRRIRSNNQNDFRAAALELLHEWNERGTHTKEDLANELREAGLRRPAERLIGKSQENYIDQASVDCERIPSMSPELLQQCVDELKQYNKQYLSTLQADPLDLESPIQLERVFTNLKLLEKGRDGHTQRMTPLAYNDLLSTEVNGVIPKRLLVEGEGGAGKTTLCKKIVWDWTHGKAFQQFKMVLYIPLQKAKGMTVGQIIKDTLSDSNQVEAWQLDEYILTNPDDVFLIFDAFDEFDGEFNQQIVKVILNRHFKSCTTLVTTRPWRADEIRLSKNVGQAYAFIAVEGFSQENLSSYITKFFAPDKASADELNEFMKENDVIAENMAPFPIYAVMLCIMWKEYDGEHREAMCKLQTFSQLFGEMISFLVDHYVSKVTESFADPILFECRQTIFRFFPLIGRIAFQGLVDRRMVFNEGEFKTNQEAMEIGCNVGVLTREQHVRPRRERTATSGSTVSTVQFPHKLFQEYLAGVYLASLHSSDRIQYNELMADVIHKSKEFRYLLYFSSTQSKEVGWDVISRLVRNLPESRAQRTESDVDLDFFVDVAFECLDLAVLAKAVGDRDVLRIQTLEINALMSPHTISGYLFIKEHLRLTKLVVERSCGRTISSDLAELMCSSPSLRCVDIGNIFNDQIKLHDDFYTVLVSQEGKSMIETLTNLTLNGLNLPPNDTFYSTLASMSSSSKIETLKISDIKLPEKDSAPRDLARFICEMPLLTKLTLGGHNLAANDAFCSALASLALSLKIETLTIGWIQPPEGDSASRDLARFISEMPRLTNLTFENLNLPASDAFWLTLASMTSSSKIQTLKIIDVELPEGESASRDLARLICEMPRLTDLNLTRLNLPDNDDFCSALASMASSSKIETLMLWNVELPEGESASRDLARFICQMPHLTELTLDELNLPANNAFWSTLASMASSLKVKTLALNSMIISTRHFWVVMSLPMLRAVRFGDVSCNSKTENDSESAAPDTSGSELTEDDGESVASVTSASELTEDDGESDASVTSASELTEDNGESVAPVTSASELTEDDGESDASITSASELTEDDDESDAPVTSVSELTLCNVTLSHWRFGSMTRMFHCVEIVTLMLYEDWSPDKLHKLQLPCVREITLQGHFYSTRLPIEPSSLCEIFKEAFPQLVKVTFSKLVIGNDDAADVVRGVMSHAQLRTIRLVKCDTDERLDPVLEDINREGRVHVDAEHGKEELDRRN